MDSQLLFTFGMLLATWACVLGVFYICAACLRDETNLHDIKVEARRMRIEFDRRVSARNIGSHADTSESSADTEGEEPFMTV